MSNLDTFKQLCKQNRLTHADAAKLLHITKSMVDKWSQKATAFPLWPLLLLQRKLKADFPFKAVENPQAFLRKFYEAHHLTRKQMAELVGVGESRFVQWLSGDNPCPQWAIESLVLGVLFDSKAVKRMERLHYEVVKLRRARGQEDD